MYIRLVYLAVVMLSSFVVVVRVRRKARMRTESEEAQRHEETKRMMTRFSELAPYDWKPSHFNPEPEVERAAVLDP